MQDLKFRFWTNSDHNLDHILDQTNLSDLLKRIRINFDFLSIFVVSLKLSIWKASTEATEGVMPFKFLNFKANIIIKIGSSNFELIWT